MIRSFFFSIGTAGTPPSATLFIAGEETTREREIVEHRQESPSRGLCHGCWIDAISTSGVAALSEANTCHHAMNSKPQQGTSPPPSRFGGRNVALLLLLAIMVRQKEAHRNKPSNLKEDTLIEKARTKDLLFCLSPRKQIRKISMMTTRRRTRPPKRKSSRPYCLISLSPASTPVVDLPPELRGEKRQDPSRNISSQRDQVAYSQMA